MKLIRVVDRPECNPRWRSEPLKLSYGRLSQPDISVKIREASVGACDDARARAIPVAHVRVEFLDAAGEILETTPDFLEGVETFALDHSVKVKLSVSGHVDLNPVPRCILRVIPAGQ